MTSNAERWPPLFVEARVKPNLQLQDLAYYSLSGVNLGVIFGQRVPSVDGASCFVFNNPLVIEIAETIGDEQHGFFLLVELSEGEEAEIFETDLLCRLFGKLLVHKRSAEYQKIQNFLGRAQLMNPRLQGRSFAFGVCLPRVDGSTYSDRKKRSLAHDVALSGSLYYASRIERLLNCKNSQRITLRPHEEIIVEGSEMGVALIFLESFETLEDKVFAMWVCKQLKSQNQSWRFHIALRTQKDSEANQHSMKVTWEFAKEGQDMELIRSVVALLGVAFRPFLEKSMSQVRFRSDREAESHVRQILWGRSH